MFRRQPDTFVPDGVPVLSAGRHRSPRRGACFMEMASYLAGEEWSDHPRCTHPTLARLARNVNDALGDVRRQELAVLIPDVVGLHPTDPRVPVELMRLCALSALPVVAMERQNVMALALLTADGYLGELDGHGPGHVSAPVRAALDLAPQAERWAREFAAQVSRRQVTPEGVARVVDLAVVAIAQACIEDPAARLVALLRDGIEQTRRLQTDGVRAERVRGERVRGERIRGERVGAEQVAERVDGEPAGSPRGATGRLAAR